MNRREQEQFPALKPQFNLKTRNDLIDYDYLDKLSPGDKLWLNKFTEEYVNCSLNRGNLKKNFHYNKRLKKDCDDRNNARNRDIHTVWKAMGLLYSWWDELTKKQVIEMEDLMIHRIDNPEGEDDGYSES